MKTISTHLDFFDCARIEHIRCSETDVGPSPSQDTGGIDAAYRGHHRHCRCTDGSDGALPLMSR